MAILGSLANMCEAKQLDQLSGCKALALAYGMIFVMI
jgi:hypothetical protein